MSTLPHQRTRFRVQSRIRGLGSLMVLLALCGSASAITLPAYQAYQDGVRLERAGRLTEAIAALRRANALSPDDPLTLTKLGAVLNAQGQTKEALSVLRRTATLDAQDTMIWFTIGGLEEQMGDVGQAEAAYLRGVKLNPSYRFGYFNLARVSVQLNKLSPALEAITVFLQTYPRHYDARRMHAQLLLATGKGQEAALAYEHLKQDFPSQFADHLDLARALTRANSPDKALQALRDAYLANGSKADIAEEMGNAHIALKQPSMALASFRRALSLNPNKPELLLRIADLNADTQQLDEAVDFYNRYLEKRPQDIRARRALAAVFLEQKRYEQAGQTLTDALTSLANTPADNPDLLQERANIQRELAYARQMAGDLPGAIAIYEQLMASTQRDAQLQRNLAIAYHRQGELPKASRLYRQLLQTPEHAGDTTLKTDLMNVLLTLGDQAATDKQWPDAVTHYQEATQLASPDAVAPWMGLGTALAAQEQWAEAEAPYRTVLSRQPSNQTAQLALARLALKTEKPSDAVAVLTPLADALTSPSAAPAPRVLQPQDDGLFGSLPAPTVPPTPTQNPEQTVEVLVTLAQAHSALGHPPEAIQALEKALALQPENESLLISAGNLSLQSGQLDQAKGFYQRAAALNPRNALVQFNLGVVLQQQAQWDAAFQAYREALRLNAQLSEAYYGLATVQEQRRQYPQALETYETYLKQPITSYQAEAEARVKVLREALAPKPAAAPVATQSLQAKPQTTPKSGQGSPATPTKPTKG